MNCIFCNIVAGKIPCYKIYEDANFIAFLDIKPLNPGNSLVIPKKHFRWVDDVPNFGEYFEVAKKVGMAIKRVLGATSISYITLGFEVPHAHIRVVPRFDNDGHNGFIKWNNIKQIPKEEMEEISSKISNMLRGRNC